MQKVSLVLTVLNENTSIKRLMEALAGQSKKPDEIIFIDAGSTDGTIDRIRKVQEENRRIRLLVEPGANRSRGRNVGIERAHGPIIALTDGGCRPKKDWLKKLTAAFTNKEVDVVGGFYLPEGDSLIQKALSVYTCAGKHQLHAKTFLPASRSMAFRKPIWRKVGGFPEELTTCEDRVFVERLRDAGAKFATAPRAIVYWEQKKTWKEAFLQLYGYAKGDMEAQYFPHVLRIGLVWLRYLLAGSFLLSFPLLLLFFLPQYLAWVIGKGYMVVKDKRALYLLPLMQLTADLAVLSGSLAGMISKKRVLQ
jgi:glycosyltransferase involved in cell wall biosynthesis